MIHHVVLASSLPFVHTARRSYRLNRGMNLMDQRGVKPCEKINWISLFVGTRSRNKVFVGEPAEGSFIRLHQPDDLRIVMQPLTLSEGQQKKSPSDVRTWLVGELKQKYWSRSHFDVTILSTLRVFEEYQNIRSDAVDSSIRRDALRWMTRVLYRWRTRLNVTFNVTCNSRESSRFWTHTELLLLSSSKGTCLWVSVSHSY